MHLAAYNELHMSVDAVRGDAEATAVGLPYGAYDELASGIWKLGRLLSPRIFGAPRRYSVVSTGRYRPYAEEIDLYTITPLDFDPEGVDMSEFEENDELAEDADGDTFSPDASHCPKPGPLAVELSVRFGGDEQGTPERRVHTATIFEIEPYDWTSPGSQRPRDDYWPKTDLSVWCQFKLQASRRIALSCGVTISAIDGSVTISGDASKAGGHPDDPAVQALHRLARRSKREKYDQFMKQLNILTCVAEAGQ